MRSKFNLKYIFLLLLIIVIIVITIYFYMYIKNKTYKKDNKQILSYPGCTATLKEISDCSDKFRNSGSNCGKNCKYCENALNGGEDCIPESCNCN